MGPFPLQTAMDFFYKRSPFTSRAEVTPGRPRGCRSYSLLRTHPCMANEDHDSGWRNAVLSELYVTWLTSAEGEEQILKLIKQVLDNVQRSGSSSTSAPSAKEPAGPASSTSSDGASTGHRSSLVKTTQFVQSPTRDTSPNSPSGHHAGPQYLSHFDGRHGSTGCAAAHQDPNLALQQKNAASEDDIPCFYSRNLSQGMLATHNEEEMRVLDELLSKFEDNPITKATFAPVSSTVFKVPHWMKDLLFDRIVERTQGVSAEELSVDQVFSFFRDSHAKLTQTRRLFEIIKADTTRNYITLEDLTDMAKYLVAVHPGLLFLRQPEFQDYYSRTVAIRIMYALEHQQAKKIYWQDFNRSSLPDVVHQLDAMDVNKVLEYFSYEHFYVLYCKFWELDTDRDLHLNYFDMCNYGQGMLTPLVVKRVVDGYGRALSSGSKKFLDYEDFIYFCLSEEDKNSQAAVYYWFKVLDLDADGILSGYELSFFVSENQPRLAECFGTEKPPSYEDMLCQMLDMLGVDPQRMKSNSGGLTLADFRACPTPANFFNMVFNASKFCAFVSDPFSEVELLKSVEKTDWDRFAREEYDRMAEEAQ
eukprot:gene5340-3839_t